MGSSVPWGILASMIDDTSLDPFIVKAVTDEQAVFILGSGFSAAYGMLTTSDLCRTLRTLVTEEARRHDTKTSEAAMARLEAIAPSDLGRLAEQYDHFMNNGAAKEWVSSEISSAMVKVDVAKAGVLADLPMSTIVTTNYDSIVELAFDHKVDVRFRDDDMARLQHLNRPCLLKIHGTASDPTSLLLKRDDYNTFRTQRKATHKVLQGLLLQRLPIIIGHSLDDENIRELIKELRQDVSWHTPIVIVQRHVDSALKSEWEKYHATFIEGDAHQFLLRLSDAVREFRRTERTSISSETKTVNEVIEGDFNPFKYFQTDKISDSHVEIIRDYFIPIPEYAKVLSPASNTIVAGSRGSGKTMLLRYLALEVQLTQNKKYQKLPFVGFYVKCGAKLFSSQYCRGNGTCEDREWVDYFTHVFNLAIAMRICQVLELIKAKGSLSFARQNEKDFSSQLVQNLIRCSWRTRFERPTFANAEKAIADLFNSARSAPISSPSYKLPLDFLYQVVKLLGECHNVFKGRPIFFLLDEMENLTSAQWEVVNCFLKERDDPITYKVAASSEGRPITDANGHPLLYEHDFTLVSTDRYSKDDAESYFSFLEMVANRCLEASDCGITKIKDLLEQRDPRTAAERLRFTGREFSGFKRYAYLSSGVVRIFVSLLKDTVSSFEPTISRRHVTLSKIPFQKQDAVIQIKSNIHRQAYLETKHPDRVLALLNALARVFREELNRSRVQCAEEVRRQGTYDRERLRTVSQIQVQNYSQLTEQLVTTLDEAMDVGLLQRPIGARQPQQHKQVPHENFKLHRMLCPYYELALANRWPRKIDASLLNEALQISDGEFARRVMTRSKPKEDFGQQAFSLANRGEPDQEEDSHSDETAMEFEHDAE